MVVSAETDQVAVLQLRAAQRWAAWLRTTALLTIPVQVVAVRYWAPQWNPLRDPVAATLAVATVVAAIALTARSALRLPSDAEDNAGDVVALLVAAFLAMVWLYPAAVLFAMASIPSAGALLYRRGWTGGALAVSFAGFFAIFAGLPIYVLSVGWGSLLMLAIFIAVLAACRFSIWWWRETEQLTIALDDADDARRSQLSMTVERLLHDGVVAIMERVAAGHPVDDIDRRAVAELTNRIRRDLLGDTVPRSISRFADDAVEQAALAGVRLVRMEYFEGDPPAEIIAAFHDATSALIANLRHAGVDNARLAVDATPDSLLVTLVDDGPGLESALPIGPTTQRRVIDRMEEINGSATPTTRLGEGVMWRLAWTRP
jgi:hypothetical protein